jgi:CRP-like cAMP-binding protein
MSSRTRVRRDEPNLEAYSVGNRLLDALPARDVIDLADDIAIVHLKARQTTQSAGQTIRHVDFPIDAVLSIVATLKSGDTIEVGTVGSESFVESEVALSSPAAVRTAFCQVEGRVGRMSVERFSHRMLTSETFAASMRHNVRAALFSAQQFTVCNLKHSALQRCARWLAMTLDRVGRPQFSLSREFLAIMLGADAAVVSQAASALEKAGAIRYAGNAVSILDSVLLQDAACECYAVTKGAFAESLLR